MDNHTPDTIEIQLGRGYVTIIDAIDADLTSNKWYARQKRIHAYAARSGKPYTKRQPTTYYLHKVIMERIIGRSLVKGEEVDHANLDSLDNRRSNLRLASRSQNAHNTKGRVNSHLKGISFHKGANKWMAHITVNCKSIYLGLFDTPVSAHEAYCKAAEYYYGEFARFE
jgi:hypothetical protein